MIYTPIHCGKNSLAHVFAKVRFSICNRIFVRSKSSCKTCTKEAVSIHYKADGVRLLWKSSCKSDEAR